MISLSYCVVFLNEVFMIVSGVFLLVVLMMVVISMFIRFLFMIRFDVSSMLWWFGILV